MKVGAILDGNGHFQVAKLEDREKMLEVIKNIDDGDYFNDVERDAYEESGVNLYQDDIEDVSEENYINFVNAFVQRGTFEIVEL